MNGKDSNYYARYAQQRGLNASQASNLFNLLGLDKETSTKALMTINDSGFDPTVTQQQSALPVEEEKDKTLSGYSEDINNLINDERFSQIYDETNRAAINNLLIENNVNPRDFFAADPDAGIEDVLRVTNFNGFADKEKAYKDPSVISDEANRQKALEDLNKEYTARWQNAYFFPELGGELNRIVPDYIKNDPDKRAQFERAFNYETGAKIDFDESGRVGDIYTDSVVGNAFRGAGYVVNDLMSEVVNGTLATSNALYDVFGGDLEQADVEFKEKQEAGEVETAMQREERLLGEGVGLADDKIFWAAFTSPEARRQLYSTNKGAVRTVDFQAIMDKGGFTEASAGEVWGAGIDQLVQSAPLLLDLVGGQAIAKSLLKGATKSYGKRRALKAGEKAIRKEGVSAARDPKTGKFLSNAAAKQLDDRVDFMLAQAAKTQRQINQVGAFFVSDALVASQIHADNVGQEWYDNLTPGERFTYLGVQAGAEVASGMVLSNIFARGFGAGKMTQNIFNGQKNAMKEYGKNVVRSTFLGAGEEVIAEGATAAVQYWNEVQARKAGGDVTAYFDQNELNRRVYEGASAGFVMGGMAGGFSGTVGGAAKATLANFARKTVEAKKEQAAAAEAVNKAVTTSAKEEAMKRLEKATKNYSASQGAMARAYNKIAQSDPEVFDEIARTQGQINLLVQQHKASNDPEYQGAIFQEIKGLVEQKQQLESEAAKSAGVESFEELYTQEFDGIVKSRGEKVKAFRAKMESDPNLIAQKEIEGQLQAQRDALEAAEAVNSPEQNADDDTQDREGQTQEDSGMVRDEEAPIEGVEGTADKPMNPNALEGQPLADKYRDLTEKMNNLLKAFKPLGINAVVHTTEQSFFNATGSTALGVFRRGKTVHINLEQKGATANTVRHEFLHAAFTTVTSQKKQQFLEELRGISGINARNIEKAVEEAYQDVSPEVLVEEKIVNILERTLDNQALEARQSVIQKILNAFRRMLGVKEQITESDLQGFVRQFRAAERTGTRFEGQQVGQSADMEAREFGVRQPSKAYPDLINKVVNYRVYYLDKLGGQQSYQTNGLRFNDYWHFRNWYLKETGNGKMADNLGQFTYTGDDGTIKKINPPKPKRDRETGEIIDMEPRLRTPQQRKMEKAAESDVRRKRVVRYRDIKVNAGKALKFAVGKIQKIDKTGELAFYNEDMLLEQDSQSELPVAYSETFFTEGLNVDELDQLGRDFGNNLEFLIPITQEADFAFTVRNNGDETVTIDAHSNVLTGFEKGEGDVLAEGKASPEQNLEAKPLVIPKSNNLGKEEVRGDILSDTSGKLALSLGFDKTGDFSGVRELISRGGEIITSHINRTKAKMVHKQLVDMALQEAQDKGMKPGDVGEIVIYHTLLGKESTLGNPYVFSEIMKKFADAKEMEASFNKDTGDAKIFRNALEGVHTSADPDLDKLFDDIDEGKNIQVDEVLAKKVVDLLLDKLDSFDFSARTKIAKELTNKESRDSIYKKYNDSVWDDTPIGNVVAYTVLPFKYDPSSPKKPIRGFKVGTESNRKNPFRGLIQPEPIFGADGKLVASPKTLIPNDLYHLAELMPGTVTKLDKKGDKEQVTERVSDLPISQQIAELNPRAAISAVKGRVEPKPFPEPENSTRDLESRDLGLNLDNESQMPFEPNRLNGFQAFMARVDQLFANKYANVFSLQRAIEGAKKAVVDISQDFINAETLMYGKTANDLEKLDEKVKVISQEMKDAGLIGEDVSQFLIARHAEERNALIAERTDGETLSGSGMSNERAQEVMDSFSPEKKAALESIAKKVDAITKDTRQTMVKFGLESQETIDAFEAMFDNYVPLGGLSADEMSADTSLYPTGGAGMSIYGDTTRRARGRASEANNVLAQAIAQNAAVHAKARKNEALSSLYNLVEANPNTKVWRISNEVPFDAQSAVGVRVNGDQKFIVFTNADHAKALKNMGVEKLDLFSKVMRSFSGFLRRSFTTANPEFIISNFARDIQSALFNAMAEADIPGGQIQSKYIATKIIQTVKKTLPALLKDAVGKDMDPEMAAYFEEFKEDGGQTGWGFVKDVGTIAAEIEAEVNEKNKAQKAREWMMKNSIDVVENVNDAFENSIRLAAYMEARKAGASREKAAELAKNITVNFNRSGELGAVANAWYMFFNASVQGTVRLARSLGTLKDVRKPNGELESWHNRLNAAQKMAFGLSLTTGMLTALNLAMSDEDEDGVLFYNKIPDYEKERNLIIMYDGQNYLKIPLPYGFNVFANMGSAMAEVAGGQRDMTDAGMFLLNSAFSSFSPISFGQSKDAAKYLAKGATPTIFKPLVDIAVNESYFGSSVYKEQFPVGAPKPEAEMSFRSPEGVRKFFQWMNEATGGSEFVPGKVDFNPDKFWYGFEYYIGGAGQFVTRTVGTSKDLYETIKEGEKVQMKANDFPFLRKVYGEFSKYYDSDVYVENANTVSQLYKERKESDNKSDARYKGIVKLESARKKTEKQIKRLRELRKEARDIENYVERQNRIYELYEKERSILMKFNKQYEQLRGQD